MAKLNFDKSKANVVNSFSSIPQGIYEMEVESCEVTNKTDSDGEVTHQVLKVVCKISEGPHKNRKVFPRFNLVNPNERCVGISQALLSKLADACGLYQLDDSDELVGKLFAADVRVTPPKSGFGEGNDIVNYYEGSVKNTHKNPELADEKTETTNNGDFSNGEILSHFDFTEGGNEIPAFEEDFDDDEIPF